MSLMVFMITAAVLGYKSTIIWIYPLKKGWHLDINYFWAVQVFRVSMLDHQEEQNMTSYFLEMRQQDILDLRILHQYESMSDFYCINYDTNTSALSYSCVYDNTTVHFNDKILLAIQQMGQAPQWDSNTSHSWHGQSALTRHLWNKTGIMSRTIENVCIKTNK